ncbi:MAG TPA: trigger factor [Mycobacteriales bacterium]|nr:trigger factor [Mycobacteriales bacterium]
MKSTIETLSPTRVRLAVEVPFDELGPSLDRAYKSIAKQVRVPGFRPGKVPARIIDQRVGRAVVLDEAVQDAIPRAYAEAVQQNEVRTVGQPEIELTRLDDGDSLAFTAEVDVRPPVILPQLDSIAVTVDDVEVTDEEVDRQLDALRERFAVLTAADRAVLDGDYVSIDLRATVDGEEVPGGSTTGLSYEVGGGDIMPGLDEALRGMSAGEDKTFGTELVAGDFAGRNAEVAVAVRSVKEKELPALDDDFAQTASEFDTLDELRADVRGRLDRVKALEQGGQARDRVLDELLAATDVPLPESAVASEVEWRQHDITHQLESAGMSLDDYLAAESRSQEDFDGEIRRNSETAVKSQLVLDALAEREQLGVSDAELTEHVVLQARRYGVPPQEYAQRMTEGGNLPALVAEVRRSKALAHLLESAAVTDASGRPVDLTALRRPSLFGADADGDGDGAADRAAADDADGGVGEPVMAAESTGSGDSDPS